MFTGTAAACAQSASVCVAFDACDDVARACAEAGVVVVNTRWDDDDE